MSSAWGNAWAKAWGNAWGSIAKSEGGSGPKRKKDTRFIDQIRRNLEDKPDVILQDEPKKVTTLAPVFTEEEFSSEALLLELANIKEALYKKEAQFEADEISKAELEFFVQEETETIQIILMALQFDKDVILQIIT